MMKKALAIAFAVCSLCSPLGAGELEFDIGKAPAPLFTCPIYGGAADPTVVWNEGRQEWWILYTARRANQHLEGPVAYCYGTPIGIAASKDHGKSWYYKGELDLPVPDKGRNTLWAPHVFKDGGTYHLIVTYIEGVWNDWGGSARMKHYKSDDLEEWEFVCDVGTQDCIDGSVYKMPDGLWKMWYKKHGKTCVAYSTDLRSWDVTDKVEIGDGNHEAPVVIKWKGRYWNIIDPCSLSYAGLKIYESEDGSNWTFNNDLLNMPGKRRMITTRVAMPMWW